MKLIEGSRLRGIIEVHHDFQLPSGKSVPLVVRYSLWKGARWINVEIEAPKIESEEFHCVWRTAWANESALINSWQQGSKGKLPAPLQGIVELIEIDDTENRTYLATYGNSIHHKWDNRYLVTQLTEQPDRSTRSQLAIGMDWSRPLETARDLFDPPFFAGILATEATVDEGAWLAQSNVPNIGMLFESNGPIEVAGDGTTPSESADATVWLHETRGRRAVSKLSFFKPVEEAWRINSQNHQWTKLDVEDGVVFANLRPSEQCRIAIKWSRNA